MCTVRFVHTIATRNGPSTNIGSGEMFKILHWIFTSFILRHTLFEVILDTMVYSRGAAQSNKQVFTDLPSPISRVLQRTRAEPSPVAALN